MAVVTYRVAEGERLGACGVLDRRRTAEPCQSHERICDRELLWMGALDYRPGLLCDVDRVISPTELRAVLAADPAVMPLDTSASPPAPSMPETSTTTDGIKTEPKKNFPTEWET